MRNRISRKGIALLLLLCMLLPLVPISALPIFAAGVDNILIFDDFQNEPSEGYYADTGGHYETVLSDGRLVIKKISSTDYNTAAGHDNTAYLFPYTAMQSNTTISKLTVSFEFTLLETPETASSLFLAYGAKADATAPTTNAALQTSYYNYGFAGLRLANGAEFAGRVLGGARNRKYRGHFLSGTPTADYPEGTRTNTNYLSSGNHTFTAQIQSNGESRVYIDGLRYLVNGTEAWADTSLAKYVTLQGLFGIDLWANGTRISIDNFLVYEGHGSLSSTPTSTIGKTAGPAKVIVHDSFDDPYAYAYADAKTTWTQTATSTVENGSLILDATGGIAYHKFYQLPYKIPAGTTAFTAEIKFRILQPYQTSQTVNGEKYTTKYRTDVMMVYGDSRNNDTRMYFSGLRVGDFNHKGTYQYDQNHSEFWGAFTNGAFNRLYRSMQGDHQIGNGFATGETYTLVVKVNTSGAQSYIKEFQAGTPDAWSTRTGVWDGYPVNKDVTDTARVDPVANHDDITGYLGFYTGQAEKIALDEITVYDGNYTPLTEQVTEHIYDDFVMTDVFNHGSVSNANGTSSVSGGNLTITRKTSSNVLVHHLPHTLPATTETFTSNVQFSLDLTGKTAGDTMDVMLSFGRDANGYWTTGMRIKETVIEEFMLYSNSTNHQQGRVYRRLANIGWGSKDASGNAIFSATNVLTLKTVVTAHTVRNTLITSDGTSYTFTGSDDQWIWDAYSGFEGFYLYSFQKGADGKYALTSATKGTTINPISLSFTKQVGGNLGFYCNAGMTGGKIVYRNIRVCYTHTKAIVADGTLLYHEGFDGADAAKTFNYNGTNYHATVENGALKLQTINAAGTAYMLPVELSGVSSFTAEIVISTEAGCTGFDAMLVYGAKANNYGWAAGYRATTGTEWMATMQKSLRRAYRGINTSSATTPSLGYDVAYNHIAPIPGQKYTFVIEVKNGYSYAYVKGFPKNSQSDTVYGAGSFPKNAGNEMNHLLENSAEYTLTNTGTGNIHSIANCLDGQIGLINEFTNKPIYIDSITITSGFRANHDIKQVADGTILYENDFNNANIDDYIGQVGYDAALTDGALTITKNANGNIHDLYLLPRSNIAGAKAMTVTFDVYGLDLDAHSSSVMLGYNAADKNNYRFCGWRQSTNSAVEQFGYIKTKPVFDASGNYIGSEPDVGGRYYRNYLKTISGSTATYIQHGDLEGAWHQITIVITADKAVMYIDGNRLLWRCEEDRTQNANGDWTMELYSSDADSTAYVTDPPPAMTGGALGLFLCEPGTSFQIDNIVCTAGTLGAASGAMTFSEGYAGQATLDASQIDGVYDTAYDRSGELTTSFSYKQANHGIPNATTRVLWDMGYLYLYTEVVDTSVNDTIDCVTYYISEDNSIGYQSGKGAYTVTVYRNGAYVIGNPEAANTAVVKSKDNGSSGYIIEAKIPLVTMGTQTPFAGADIGFNYVVTDQNGWTAWTPGHGAFTTSPDTLDRLTFVFTASPTGDTVTLLPYVLFGGMALIGALGVFCVITKKKKNTMHCR